MQYTGVNFQIGRKYTIYEQNNNKIDYSKHILLANGIT